MTRSPDWAALLSAASSDVRRLDCVDRYGSVPVTLRETTSQHMFWVALYSMMIHRELGGPKDLDAAVMLHALTHDLCDSVSGEVPRTFKYSSKAFRKAVQRAEEKVVGAVAPCVLNLYREALDFADGAGAEGWYVRLVVKAADFVSVYEYLWRERNKGNREIEPFHARMRRDMERMAAQVGDEKPGRRFQKYVKPLAALYLCMAENKFLQEFRAT